nr:promethin isoform X1 [Aotus nancymaae]XP_012320125.1 promethin isoform X1 [Aotus nancymaae]
MAKEEPRSISRDLKELQRKLCLLIEFFQNNPKVMAFTKSPVGQYLDRHPFLALALLVFIVTSAVPVGFFLLLVILTTLVALVGVIILEGSLFYHSPPWKVTQLGEQYFWGICHLKIFF